MGEREYFLQGSSATVLASPSPDEENPQSWLLFQPGLAPLVMPDDWFQTLFEERRGGAA